MITGERVRLRDRGDAQHAGVDERAIGVVLQAYVDDGNLPRVNVQFDGIELLEGWHPAMFVAADQKA